MVVIDLEGIADLKRTDEVWLLLVRRVRGYVDDEGKLKRPYLLLLYEIAPNTILRNHKIVLEHRLGCFPKPEYVLKLLADTMLQPLEALKQPPHRPATLIFTSKFLYSTLLKDINKMRILPKYWTEEENQNFGDDFVTEISRKLVEKKGFGEGKASHKPGLLSVSGTTPEQIGELYRGAADFFKEAPWKMFSSTQVFAISWKEEVRLFTVTGKQMEPGLIMETEWPNLRSIIESGKKPGSDYYCAMIFAAEEGIPFADLEAIERYEWPLATRSIVNSQKIPNDEEQANCFPLPVCFPDSPPDIEQMFRPKWWELLWFEVAAKAVAQFTREFNQDDSKADVRFTLPLSGGKNVVRVTFWSSPEQWTDLENFFKHEKVNLPQVALGCVVCNKIENGTDMILKRCGGCKKKMYCSRECQAADWKTHKLKCVPSTATPTTTTTTTTVTNAAK
eukprot:TRINITY_DN12953_c0_g1_i1.p1 TRINITY_DN12953_c0_g1~~TRINITY_DN12953_c0_g1_i1.p1  ORF type:complete len:448 (+),score=102.43 TRINITY_DN12953_c0_g1_i1:126-1469(+)